MASAVYCGIGVQKDPRYLLVGTNKYQRFSAGSSWTPCSSTISGAHSFRTQSSGKRRISSLRRQPVTQTKATARNKEGGYIFVPRAASLIISAFRVQAVQTNLSHASSSTLRGLG